MREKPARRFRALEALSWSSIAMMSTSLLHARREQEIARAGVAYMAFHAEGAHQSTDRVVSSTDVLKAWPFKTR